MRPGEQQYLYAQHHQQAQQQAALQLNSSGFSQLQQHSGNPGAYFSPHYGQLAAVNGVQVMGGMGPMGGGGGAMPVMQRGLLPMQQNGILHHNVPYWAQLRPDSQAWGSGVYPASQQGMMQSNLVQQHVQQQQQQHVAYLQDLRSGSVGLNGMPLPPVHGGDGLRGSQQWTHPHDVQGQYGGAHLPQDIRRHQDGMRPGEFSRNGAHGNVYPHQNGNSHNKGYDKNNRSSGNWSRGGSTGRDPSNNPRFKGGKNEIRRVEEQMRSQTGSLRCDACDRTFKNSQQFTAHNNTHIKCDVDGCSFQASGRVVKEHKQSVHENIPSDIHVRVKSFMSKESKEEISKWIEERKRNYPTAANIKRKADELRARKLRGELVDVDARKRKERLKEILAKQAALGVPVAEVPAYYMSDRYGSLKGKGARGESSASGPSGSKQSGKRGHDRGRTSNGVATEEDTERPAKVPRGLAGSNDSAEPVVRACKLDAGAINGTPGIVEAPDKSCFFYKRGRCKKGNRCEFLHERRLKKKKDDGSTQSVSKRGPTLLTKLLDSDIRREKSHLLQSFRFFVNNMFLLEFPEKPLEFFEWQESSERNSDGEVGRPDINTEEVELEEKDEDGSDEDVQTTHADEDAGEITRLDGEDQENEIEPEIHASDGEAHDPEDWFDFDDDLFHLEESGSEGITRSIEEDLDVFSH